MLSKYDEESKKIQYTLPTLSGVFDITKAMSLYRGRLFLPEFKYLKKVLHVHSEISDKKKVMDSIPKIIMDDIKQQISGIAMRNNNISDHDVFMKLYGAANAYYTSDELFGVPHRTILFNFDTGPIKHIVKVVFLGDNYVLHISRAGFPGRNYCTDYMLYNCNSNEYEYSSTVRVSCSDKLESISHPQDWHKLVTTTLLDSNHAIYTIEISGTNNQNKKFHQELAKIFDLDAGIISCREDLEEGMDVCVKKMLMAMDNVDSILVVPFKDLCTTEVYDIFGNVTTYDKIFNSILQED